MHSIHRDQIPTTDMLSLRKRNSIKMRKHFKRNLKGAAMRIKFLQARWRFLRDAVSVMQRQYISPFQKGLKKGQKVASLVSQQSKEKH